MLPPIPSAPWDAIRGQAPAVRGQGSEVRDQETEGRGQDMEGRVREAAQGAAMAATTLTRQPPNAPRLRSRGVAAVVFHPARPAAGNPAGGGSGGSGYGGQGTGGGNVAGGSQVAGPGGSGDGATSAACPHPNPLPKGEGTSSADSLPKGDGPDRADGYIVGQPPRQQDASREPLPPDAVPGQPLRPGEWEPSPDRPPKRDDKDKDDDDKSGKHPKPKPVASKRGDDWALREAGRGSVGVTRPMCVECYADRLVVVSDRGPSGDKVVPLGPRTSASVNLFISAVWDQIGAWGMAGRGMYWRPILQVRVAPDAEQRFSELSRPAGRQRAEGGEKIVPRPIPQHAEPVNGDSFLDIVASVVSIMIIMVVMEGVRIKNAPVTVALPATPADAELEKDLAAEQSLRGDVWKMAEEIRGVQREAAVHGAAARSARHDGLGGRAPGSRAAAAARRRQAGRFRFGPKHRGIEVPTRSTCPRAPAGGRTPPGQPVVVESYPTPISREVDGPEAHLMISQGRVVFVPMEELVDQLKSQLRRQAYKLADQPELSDTIGPVDGFRLHYTLERRDLRPTAPGEPVAAAATYRSRSFRWCPSPTTWASRCDWHCSKVPISAGRCPRSCRAERPSPSGSIPTGLTPSARFAGSCTARAIRLPPARCPPARPSAARRTGPSRPHSRVY